MRRPAVPPAPLLAALFLLAPLPVAAAAGEDPTVVTALPEVVVTARRPDNDALARTPAATTVIDRATIEERGYVSLADALSAVPGLRVVQTGGPGQQASVFLRGTNSRHVLVLLDGVPVNDPSDPGAAFNFGDELVNLDVERIEVLRGPASSLYGSQAIGGTVNIVTRRAPADRAFAPFGEVAGGSSRTLRAGGGVAGTLDRFDYLLSLNTLSTRGFDATAPRFRSNTGEDDGFRGAAATARLGWRPNDTSRIEALLRWRENHFGLDEVPEDDPNHSGESRRWYGQLRGETTLFGAWTTGLRVARTEDRRRFVNEPDNNSLAATRDLYRGERTVLDWGNQLRLPDLGPFTDSHLAFGATFAREEVRQASGSAFFRTTVDARSDSGAGHLSWQARLGRLDLSAGLRGDAVEDAGSAVTWRTGAVLQLPEIASRLRATVGTGFAASSLYQRYGRIAGFFSGNPDLRPERSLSWEVGVDTDIPVGGTADFATLGATYFQTRIRDLINFDAAFTTLENVDRARIRGAEFSLTLRPAAWLSTTAAYTITDARDRATGERLARRPEHQLSVNASLKPLPGVTIAPEVLFTGRSPEGAFASYRDDGTAFTEARSNKSGTIVNLVGTWQVTEPVAVFVEGRNLGNSRFEPANGFVVPGRSLLVGTRLRL
ncbi:TonB-dependent receptor plug domain-containing protein [Roseomonas sp. BN140053]|uniref:TonB-dependent receptor plug domain-containing protein n=1 Tax=Roseomonas sp. BN140053 TaxID=3391898 RepID=UPI0039EC4E7E